MNKKVFIDSNIILRFFVRDIESQYLKSESFLEKIDDQKITGILSVLVINEIIWIMENFYYYERKDFLPKIINLLALRNIKILEIEKMEIITILQNMMRNKLDFTDLYLKEIAGKEQIFTFDRDFEKIKN